MSRRLPRQHPHLRRIKLLTVYPGDGFTVLKNYAKVTDLTPGDEGYSEEDEIYKAYTMQLRAEYGPEEASKETYMNWYKNDQDPSELLHEDKDLLINEAVDIYTLTSGIPTRTGYKFLGWAREAEYALSEDNKPTGDAITYYDVDEDDLYLKWVETTGGEGHYEAKNSSGSWVTVTQVAADEKMPYHALYAVWEKTFFVYHSSSKVLEAVTIDTEKFDITEKVANNHIYGGYFKSYGGVTVTEANKESALQNGTLTISNAEIYDGSSLTATDGTKFWSKRVKVDSEYVDNYYAENGKTMIPVSGTVYYLKEVPAAYLSNNVKYVQNIDTKIISDLYLLTTVDDVLYNEFGYEIEVTVDEPTSETVVLFNTVTIQQRGLSGDKSTVKVFQAGTTGSDTPLNTGISRGYIGYLKKTVSSIKESTDTELAFVLRPYWITLDGVVVHGVERTYTIGSGNTTISAE